MSASKLIKHALVEERLTQAEFANIIKKQPEQFRNALYRDSMNFKTLEKWLDAIGYEVIIRKRETGKLVG